MIRAIVVNNLAALMCVLLIGCASGIDARKRISLPQGGERPLGGEPLAQFAQAHTSTLLTGADEVDRLHVSKHDVQGVFRLDGQVCRTIGGCAAVPIDARGYWLTAAHCADAGGVLIYTPNSDGIERGIPARIVWRGTGPGLDLALLFAPLPDGMSPVTVASSVRENSEVICIGSGIASDPFSAGRVVGVGGSTDGSVIWLEHDAPLSAGDSGGPAFYPDGVLAGINFEAGRSFTGEKMRATALQPNLQQLLIRINEDWTFHSSAR
ncbi:MAG: serine protease [Phycisphaerales bacterium]